MPWLRNFNSKRKIYHFYIDTIRTSYKDVKSYCCQVTLPNSVVSLDGSTDAMNRKCKNCIRRLRPVLK